MFRIKMFLFLVPSFFNSKLGDVLREALESSVVMNSITHFSLIYFITITFLFCASVRVYRICKEKSHCQFKVIL